MHAIIEKLIFKKIIINENTDFDILLQGKKNINLNKIQKTKLSINQKLIFSAADGDLDSLKELLKIGKYSYKPYSKVEQKNKFT